MMERKVKQNVTLSTGFTLPKGSNMFLTTDNMLSPDIYADPHKFIPDRFLKKREGGENSKWQFVTTSPDHLGFGHGSNACPGRFFASNELKVALVYLLLKYDWKYTKEGRLQEGSAGANTWVPQEQLVSYRKNTVDARVDGLLDPI
jgi:cytochrome P450